MLKKVLASVAVLATGSAVFAQSLAVTQNNTAVTSGPDAGSFGRNTTHFTYDLLGTTTAGSGFWTGSEVSVEVSGAGSIWHASDQNLGDPNAPDFPNNLTALASTPAAGASTRWDTFLSAVGQTGAASFAAPGGIISTATHIAGLNPALVEIPLAWFNTAGNTLSNTLLGRLTFQVAADAGLSLTQSPAFPNVFATIAGRITSASNSQGNPFSVTIYQAPEPSTLALLALGGLAGLIRRR